MVNPGDIKIVPPITQTYGLVGTANVPCWRFYYTFRGNGPFDILIPIEGFTADKLMAEITKIVEPLSNIPMSIK